MFHLLASCAAEDVAVWSLFGGRGISKVQKVSVFCLWMSLGMWGFDRTMIFPLDRNMGMSGESGETCGDLAGPGQVRSFSAFVHHWVPNDLFDATTPLRTNLKLEMQSHRLL